MRNLCAKYRKLNAHARGQGPGQHPNVLPRGAGCAVSRAIVASCPKAQGRPDTEVRANERWAPQTQRWFVRAESLPAPLPAPRLIQGVAVLQRFLWSQRPPVSNIIPHSLTLVTASSLTLFCVPHMFPIPRMK